ncbi:methyltransferase domain-containing protein [Cytobacillus praedii]|uniref:Methyltransferase domain-containing protein n=1 Tax=Cytobacillus praedii TaxID=1742358 RepID=A0A4R1B0S5_9BACI|nr:methyltransferase domain-containing protein [Cytobacillus praedii]TCJ06386.1 methyltransferase domain-containing protein [Cytobacillus praedii]
MGNINNNEIKEFKKKIKENLKTFINSNLIDEAKSLIEEYEVLDSCDDEIYSMKAVIAIMEDDFKNAERLLNEGLLINKKNADLLFNMGYIYESQEKFQDAYKLYQLASKYSNDKELNNELSLIKNNLIERGLIVEDFEDKSCMISSDRKKVLVIAYYYPPLSGSGVQRTLKFVKYLREFGWEPVVVTVGKSHYPLKDKTLLTEVPSDLELHRIEEPIEVDGRTVSELMNLYISIIKNDNLMSQYLEAVKHTNNVADLLLPDSNILWANNVLKEIEGLIDFNEIDLIYSTSGPYSDHLIGYFLKDRYKKPWVADFRDEWTNNPYAEYNKKGLLYQLHYAMESKIINYANKVITVTPPSYDNYKEIFEVADDKLELITNGYDEYDFLKINDNKYCKNDKFTIVHNGLFYSIRTPVTFLESIYNLISKGLIDPNTIRISFTWTESMDKWKEFVRDLHLSELVEFQGYISHEESLVLASKADLLLLVIGPGEKNKSVYTGKLFEYLRLCKPILSLSPQESIAEELINKTNRGKNIEFNNIQGIEDYILSTYKQWQKGNQVKLDITDDIQQFDRMQLTKKLSIIFDKVISEFDFNEFSSNIIDTSEKDSYFYDKVYETGGWQEAYFKHYSEIHYIDIWLKALQLIKNIKNPSIIDIGCGPGQFANLLFDNNFVNYKGLDFSKEAIKIAKIRNDKYRNLFKEGDAFFSEIFEGAYNTVVIFEVLEHIEEDLKLVKRIIENSNVLLSVPNFYSPGHVRWFHSKEEVYERYSKVVDIEGIYSFPVGGDNIIYLVHGKRNNC